MERQGGQSTLLTMNLPLHIARRTARSATSTQSTMVRIATVAVAVSITVMLVTMAVVDGFRKQIRATISDMSADITVTDLSTIYGTQSKPIELRGSLDSIFNATKGIASIDHYAMRGCVARSKSDAVGVVIKGVTNIDPSSISAQRITEGRLPSFGEQRTRELLLPRQVAEQLSVGIGERVELLLIEGEQLPRREIFKVCGLYNTVGDMPTVIALADIRNVQKINGWNENTYSGFEIRTLEDYSPEEVAERINWDIFDHYDGMESISAIAASELYAHIFAWLDTHNINATVIIVIMFIVALFNMVTALLILLFERTRMVGILKSLGMSNRAVREIFLYQSARIVGIGMAVGNIVALTLIAVQKFTGVVKLDATAYYVTEVPVSTGIVDILAINTIFAAAILLLLFAATAIVSRIEPSEAVKYE